MSKHISKYFFCVSLLATPSKLAFADSLQWETSRAIANGSGCRAGSGTPDTAFLANGGDLSVVFSNLGFRYPAGVSGPLLVFKNCNLELPVVIAPGMAPQLFSETVSYGIIKSPAAMANFYFSSSIMGTALQPMQVAYNYGQAAMEPLAYESRDNSLSPSMDVLREHCRSNRPTRVTYKAGMSVQGRRDSTAQDLIFLTDSLDVRLEIDSTDVACASLPPPPIVKDMYLASRCEAGDQPFKIDTSSVSPLLCVRYGTDDGVGVANAVLQIGRGVCPGGWALRGVTLYNQSLCVSREGQKLKRAFAGTCSGYADKGAFMASGAPAGWQHLCVSY